MYVYSYLTWTKIYLGLQEVPFLLQKKERGKKKKIQTDLPKKVYGPTLIKVLPKKRAGQYVCSVSHKMDLHVCGKSPYT